jgi:hypothetical protein
MHDRPERRDNASSNVLAHIAHWREFMGRYYNNFVLVDWGGETVSDSELIFADQRPQFCLSKQ